MRHSKICLIIYHKFWCSSYFTGYTENTLEKITYGALVIYELAQKGSK
jgi:hypothetical protein